MLKRGEGVSLQSWGAIMLLGDRWNGTKNEQLAAEYNTHYIPKRNGGARCINEPSERLKADQRKLLDLISPLANSIYDDGAFAYIKRRNPKRAMLRHRKNSSKWYAHYDIHDFFGSTTCEFATRILASILGSLQISEANQRALTEALRIGFLNGTLPQGSPLSPMITNIVMAPVDATIRARLGDKFVYTRYADDFVISSRGWFNPSEVMGILESVFAEFDAPYTFNRSKMRFGSISGKNYHLGMIVNQQGNISVGSECKRKLKAALTNFVLDQRNGKAWSRHEVNSLIGRISHCGSVNGHKDIARIISKVDSKWGCDVLGMLKSSC